MDEIFEKLKELIKETNPDINTDNITLDSEISDELGFGSLDLIMVSVLIEEEYNFEFSDSFKFKTVRDICEYIEKETNK